jgi:RNA polymerase sigma-70 factor (ECF subfamily)
VANPPPSTAPSDAALVRDVAAGSEDALAALYDRHASLVYGTALRLTTDRTRAEDVVLDTFLALWNQAERFDPARGSLPSWLVVVARHASVDRYRRNARHDAVLSVHTLGGARPDGTDTDATTLASSRLVAAGVAAALPADAFEAAETRAELAEAIGRLSPDERTAILLAYQEGLSQSEIADRLGWPLGTVKTRSRRALRNLRTALTVAQPTAGGQPASLVPCSPPAP